MNLEDRKVLGVAVGTCMLYIAWFITLAYTLTEWTRMEDIYIFMTAFLGGSIASVILMASYMLYREPKDRESKV